MSAAGQSGLIPGFDWPPLFEELREIFRQRPKLPLSEWAEANITLSPEYSNSTGPLMLFGWQRGIFDAITDPNIETVVIMSSTQVVKCVDVSTLLPTPEGWTRMEDIEAGGQVFDEAGAVCHVIGTSPVFTDRKCYRLTFDDGAQIICDGSHQWLVNNWLNQQRSMVLSVEEMFQTLAKYEHRLRTKTGKRNPFRVGCAFPLILPERRLPIDPYILGCWLGDGTQLYSDITVDLRDGVLAEIEKIDPSVHIVSVKRDAPNLARIKVGPKIGEGCRREDTMQTKLRDLNLIENKHIPQYYLRASEDQRRSLLQGLLDTDGTATNGHGHNSLVTLSLTTKALAYDAMELIRSLGLKPKIACGRAYLNGVDCGEKFVVTFTAYREDRPFRLKRKLEKLSSLTDERPRPTEAWRRSIVSIEPVDSVPVKCIAVDSPSNLYLVGESMIPTHNSLAIMCAIAYWIVEEPGPILLVEPKKDAARDFSKRRLMPLARDCDILKNRISGSTHDGHNTIQSKDFPGGNLLIVSAHTPVDLAQHTIRYLVCDEVDKYDEDVGGSVERQGEGDPIDLAWERAMTFGSRRKRVLACSPTVAGQSRIGKAWALSDQRRPWVPCPHCGAVQVLRFRDRHGYHVKWDSGVARELQAKTARYHCVECDQPWTEQQRWTACNHHVEWRAERPGGNVAGFWVSHMYVPPTWKTSASITQAFLNAKDDRQSLKTFLNTTLAEEWVEEGEAPDKEILYARRESYPFGDEAVVPQGGLFLTAAVDVQEGPPRLEVEVKAWGRHRENWSMGYWILQAFHENGQELPVSSRELWDKLDELLYREWPHESGQMLPILAICIDTGKLPKPVYEFARRPGHHQLFYGPAGIKLIAPRTVVPVKGTADMLRIIAKISKEDAARKRQGVRIVSIGTICAKTEIFDLLRHAVPNADESPSPGCYHFPQYDMVYFEGLTSEVKLIKANGEVTYEKRGPRNEPVDLAVYNRAAAAIVGIDRMGEEHWRRFEAAVTPIGGAPPPRTPPPAPPQPGPAGPSVQPGMFRPTRGGFRR